MEKKFKTSYLTLHFLIILGFFFLGLLTFTISQSTDIGFWMMIIFRLIAPLLMLKWPLLGGLAAVFADATDVLFVNILGKGEYPFYLLLDKMLDLYYLLLMTILSFRWGALVHNIMVGLFLWRTFGIILLSIFNFEWLLIVFPALVEFFFLFCAARDRFFPRFIFTPKRLMLVLLALFIIKFTQESILHSVFVHQWQWLTQNFLIPLGIVQ